MKIMINFQSETKIMINFQTETKNMINFQSELKIMINFQSEMKIMIDIVLLENVDELWLHKFLNCFYLKKNCYYWYFQSHPPPQKMVQTFWKNDHQKYSQKVECWLVNRCLSTIDRWPWFHKINKYACFNKNVRRCFPFFTHYKAKNCTERVHCTYISIKLISLAFTPHQ